MRTTILTALLAVLAGLVLYLLFWPVPITPVAWEAPPNPGYTGVFAINQRLRNLETLPLGEHHGPEEVVVDDQGRIYAATLEGLIIRLAADGTQPRVWANTGGRPLGIVFDSVGNLIVADAFRGLLRIAPNAEVSVLATEADGVPIRYANNVDVAADGKIYFSDASTRFGAREIGNTLPASMLELMEHGGSGRLLVYDPATGKATTLLKELHFANGVAVSADQSSVLVNETGMYRVLHYWLAGPKVGQVEPFIEQLPGFPDNLTRGQDGRYWLAMIAPRSPLLDDLADKPWLRTVIQRLPDFLRPKAKAYGHIIALDGDGKVVWDGQDPAGQFPMITSVTETDRYLYLGSLATTAVGRLEKQGLQLGVINQR